MKSYNEMAERVFQRGKEYEQFMVQRRKRIFKQVSIAVCIGVVVCFSYVLWKNCSLTFTDETISSNTIYFNFIQKIPSKKINVDVSHEDWIPMDKQQLNTYYGIDVFPEVPGDLREIVGEQGYGIYKKNDDQQVYWDTNYLNFYNTELSRSVYIEISKQALSFSDYTDITKSNQFSFIQGTKVLLAKSENNQYMAEFTNHNTGFRIITEGLDEEEFLSIIVSLCS